MECFYPDAELAAAQGELDGQKKLIGDLIRLVVKHLTRSFFLFGPPGPAKQK